MTEKPLTVLLDTATRAWLEKRASLNDRATGREAAAIIKAYRAMDKKPEARP